MARKKTSSIKMKEIDEQIKLLMKKKAEYQERANKEIGEYVVSSWGVEDIEEAKMLIDALKNDAITLLNSNDESDTSVNLSNKSDAPSDQVGTTPGMNPGQSNGQPV